MPTFKYSAPNKYWRRLCTNAVRPETSVNAEQCMACVTPVVVPVDCGGTATWGVTLDIETTDFIWELITNECTGTGTPIEPVDPPPGAGWIAVTDCCTGEVISLTEGEPL